MESWLQGLDIEGFNVTIIFLFIVPLCWHYFLSWQTGCLSFPFSKKHGLRQFQNLISSFRSIFSGGSRRETLCHRLWLTRPESHAFSGPLAVDRDGLPWLASLGHRQGVGIGSLPQNTWLGWEQHRPHQRRGQSPDLTPSLTYSAFWVYLILSPNHWYP